ncbi:MAG: hypothetical protein OHK0029_27440 [Armatimonadaceae bacterium]
MAIFAVRKIWKNKVGKSLRQSRLRRSASIATAALAAVAMVAPQAQAQTRGSGNGVVSGGVLLSEFLGRFGLPVPDPDSDDFIDLSGVLTSYILNPYIGVTLGFGGNYSVDWPDPIPGVSHEVAGMISIGNLIGSTRINADDREGLVGVTFPFPPYELIVGNKPFGYGVWPIPGHWEEGGDLVAYDYSAYARLEVDGTVVPILGGDTATALRDPQFINNALTADYDLGNGIAAQLEVRLYRATARFRWRLINTDTAAHTVALRWTVPVRPGLAPGGAFPTDGTRIGFFFNSPGLGVSNDFRDLNGSQIPDTFTIFGKRYETDDPVDPPFAAQFRFRGLGATPPNRLLISNPFEMRPENAEFDPIGDRRLKLNDGVTVAAYYGPITLQPGGATEIVTYYGNGHITEQLGNDFVIGVDGPEALAYDTSAAVDPAIAGQVNADPLTAGAEFLAPNPFRIHGGVYNQVVGELGTAISMTNVRATLTLPNGLAFGTTNTGAVDTSERVIGTLSADRGTDVSWAVRATAQEFGPLTYLLSVSSDEFGARQVSRTINIPAIPFHQVIGSVYQMIGFPFEFDPQLSNNGDASTVVNGLTNPPDEPVAFFQWVPDPDRGGEGLGGYVQTQQLQNGIGYFYRPNFSRTIFARGVAPWPDQAPLGQTQFLDVNQRQILLRRGWNIIANPYVYEIPLSNLRFVPVGAADPLNNQQRYSVAVGSGLIRPGVFYYDPQTRSYDFLQSEAETIKPWEAYWIFLNNDVTLVYQVPLQKQSGILPTPTNPGDPEPATRKRGALATGKALVQNPTPENWRLQLVATRGDGKSDRATIIGVADSLPDTERIMMKPPTPVEDYVHVGIVRNNGASRFAQDIQAGRGAKTWEMELQADKDGPVTLTWPNASTLPRRVQLTLKDVAANRSISLRNSSALTINLKKGVPTRILVTARIAASQPITISGLRAGAGSRSTGTRSFVFNLNREASVSAVVKTLTGKVVANIAASRSATAGENRLTWTGRATDGSPLPPGPYSIEVIARGEEGETATARHTFQSLQ